MKKNLKLDEIPDSPKDPPSHKKNTFEKAAEAEDLVFRYSRERRLDRAPQNVRELYYGPERKKSKYRSFNISRPTGVLFLTILFVFVFLFIMPKLLKENNNLTLEGNQISFSSHVFSDVTYITLRKNAKGDSFYTGPVEFAISALQEPQKKGGPEASLESLTESLTIENQRVFFTLNPTEEFGFSVPFTAVKLIILVKAGETIKSIQLKSQQ